MSSSVDTAEGIAHAMMEQLRMALEVERDKTEVLNNTVVELQNQNAEMNDKIDDVTVALHLESARSELAIACITNESPAVIVRAALGWLIGGDKNTHCDIQCAVRVGDSWVFVNGVDGIDYKSIPCKYFDRMVDEYLPVNEAGQSTVIDSQRTSGNAMCVGHLLSSEVLHGAGLDPHANISALAYHRRCVWLFSSPRGSNSAYASSGSGHMSDNENQVNDIAANAASTWYTVFETASSNIMSLLIKKYETEESKSQLVVGEMMQKLYSLLHCSTAESGSDVELELNVLRTYQHGITGIFSSYLDGLEIELFVSNQSASGHVSHSSIISSTRGLVSGSHYPGAGSSKDHMNDVSKSLLIKSVTDGVMVECDDMENTSRFNAFDISYGDRTPQTIAVCPLWTSQAPQRGKPSKSDAAPMDFVSGGLVCRLTDRCLNNLERLVLRKISSQLGFMIYNYVSKHLVTITDPGRFRHSHEVSIPRDDIPNSLLGPAVGKVQAQWSERDEEEDTSDASEEDEDLPQSETYEEASSRVHRTKADMELDVVMNSMLRVYAHGHSLCTVPIAQSEPMRVSTVTMKPYDKHEAVIHSANPLVCILKHTAKLFDSSWCCMVVTSVKEDAPSVLINNVGDRRDFHVSETKGILHDTMKLLCGGGSSVTRSGGGSRSFDVGILDSPGDSPNPKSKSKEGGSVSFSPLLPTASMLSEEFFDSTHNSMTILNNIHFVGSGLYNLLTSKDDTSVPGHSKGHKKKTLEGSSTCSVLAFVLNGNKLHPNGERVIVLLGRPFIPFQRTALLTHILSSFISCYQDLCLVQYQNRVHVRSEYINGQLSKMESVVAYRNELLDTLKHDLTALRNDAVRMLGNGDTASIAIDYRSRLHQLLTVFVDSCLMAPQLEQHGTNSARWNSTAKYWSSRMLLKNTVIDADVYLFEWQRSGFYSAVSLSSASLVASRKASPNRTPNRSRTTSPSISKRLLNRFEPVQSSQRGSSKSNSTSRSRANSRELHFSGENKNNRNLNSNSHSGSEVDMGSSYLLGDIALEKDLEAESRLIVRDLTLYEVEYLGYSTCVSLEISVDTQNRMDSDPGDARAEKAKELLADSLLLCESVLTSMSSYVKDILSTTPQLLVLESAEPGTGLPTESHVKNHFNSAVPGHSLLIPSPMVEVSNSIVDVIELLSSSSGRTVDATPQVPKSEYTHYQSLWEGNIQRLNYIFERNFAYLPIYQQGKTFPNVQFASLLHNNSNSYNVPSILKDSCFSSVANDMKSNVQSNVFVDVEDVQIPSYDTVRVVTPSISSVVYNYLVECTHSVSQSQHLISFLNGNCLLYSIPLVQDHSAFIHVFILCHNSNLISAIQLKYLHELLGSFCAPLRTVHVMHELNVLLYGATAFSTNCFKQLSTFKPAAIQYTACSASTSADVIGSSGPVVLGSQSLLESLTMKIGMTYGSLCRSSVAVQYMESIRHILSTDFVVGYIYDEFNSSTGVLERVSVESTGNRKGRNVLHSVLPPQLELYADICRSNGISRKLNRKKHHRKTMSREDEGHRGGYDSYPSSPSLSSSEVSSPQSSKDSTESNPSPTSEAERVFPEYGNVHISRGQKPQSPALSPVESEYSISIDEDVQLDELFSLRASNPDSKTNSNWKREIKKIPKHSSVIRVMIYGKAPACAEGVDDAQEIEAEAVPLIVMFAVLPRSADSTSISHHLSKSSEDRLHIIGQTACGVLQTIHHGQDLLSKFEAEVDRVINCMLQDAIECSNWTTKVLACVLSKSHRNIQDMDFGLGVGFNRDKSNDCWDRIVKHIKCYKEHYGTRTPIAGTGTAAVERDVSAVEYYEHSMSLISKLVSLGKSATEGVGDVVKELIQSEDQSAVFKMQYELLTDKYKEVVAASGERDLIMQNFMNSMSALSSHKTFASPLTMSGTEYENSLVELGALAKYDHLLVKRLLVLLTQIIHPEQIMQEIRWVGNHMLDSVCKNYSCGIGEQEYVTIVLHHGDKHANSSSGLQPLLGIRSVDLLSGVMTSGKPIYIESCESDVKLESGGAVTVSYLPVTTGSSMDSVEIMAATPLVPGADGNGSEMKELWGSNSNFVSSEDNIVGAIQYAIPHSLMKSDHTSADGVIAATQRGVHNSVQSVGKLCIYNNLYEYRNGSARDDIPSPGTRGIGDLHAHSNCFDSIVGLMNYVYANGNHDYVDRVFLDSYSNKLVSKIVSTVLHTDSCCMIATNSTLRGRAEETSGESMNSSSDMHKHGHGKWYVEGYVARWHHGNGIDGQSSAVVDDQPTILPEYFMELLLQRPTPTEPFIMKSMFTSDAGADKYVFILPVDVKGVGGDDNISGGEATPTSAFLKAFIVLESDRRLLEYDIQMLRSVQQCVLNTLCEGLRHRSVMENQLSDITACSHQLQSADHLLRRLMDTVHRQKCFYHFLSQLYAVGCVYSEELENDSFETISTANWEKVKNLVQNELCSIVHAASIELIPLVQSSGTNVDPEPNSSLNPISRGTADPSSETKVSDVGLVYSHPIEMSAQELALMCTTVGTAVYCEEGNIHSNRFPCVYVPILNSGHSSKIHTKYVICCMFNSLDELHAFQYEVAPNSLENDLTAESAVSGLGHNLIMDASSNLYTWLAYQYYIMELEFNRLNMNDMTNVTEQLLLGFKHVSEYLPTAGSQSKNSVYIGTLDALSAAIATAFNYMVTPNRDISSRSSASNILGALQLHWRDSNINQWITSHVQDPKLISSSVLDMGEGFGMDGLNININGSSVTKPIHQLTPIEKVLLSKPNTLYSQAPSNPSIPQSILAAIYDYKQSKQYAHDLKQYQQSQSASHPSSPVRLSSAQPRQGSDGFHANTEPPVNIWVTDILGNVIVDQDLVEKGNSIWIHCYPIYAHSGGSSNGADCHSAEGLNVNVSVDADTQATSDYDAHMLEACSQLVKVSDCLIEIPIDHPLHHCCIRNKKLHCSLFNILLELQSYTTHMINTVLHANMSSLRSQANDRYIELQSQLLSVFNDCLVDLSVEGGRIVSVCSNVQQKLGMIDGIQAVGVVCQNNSDSEILFDAFSVKSSGSKVADDELSAGSTLLGGGKNKDNIPREGTTSLFLSQVKINSTFRQLFLYNNYAEICFSCYDIVGKVFVFAKKATPLVSPTFSQQSSRNGSGSRTGLAEDSPSHSNQDLFAKRQNSIHDLNLNSQTKCILLTISKALGRRVYELVKGHKNKHIMLIKQEEVSMQRSKLQNKDDTIIGLETTKALLLQDIEHANADCQKYKDLLQQEQVTSTNATKQHKALSQQLRKVVADCKAESERKERILKKNLVELETEKAGLTVKYEKSIRDYEKLNNKYVETEKRKKEIENSIGQYKAAMARQKEESDKIVQSLQEDQAALSKQVDLLHSKEEDALASSDRRCKNLINKLNMIEDEHAQCKSTIFNLRKQADADAKLVNALKTEKSDLNSITDATKKQLAALNNQIIDLENKCKTYKILNVELSQQMKNIVQATKISNPEMVAEWNALIEKATKSLKKK